MREELEADQGAKYASYDEVAIAVIASRRLPVGTTLAGVDAGACCARRKGTRKVRLYCLYFVTAKLLVSLALPPLSLVL
jgi:hypothetical protein